jgi:hypothetical protein
VRVSRKAQSSRQRIRARDAEPEDIVNFPIVQSLDQEAEHFTFVRRQVRTRQPVNL